MKFVFIAKHRTVWPVAWLCEAMGVSRSGKGKGRRAWSLAMLSTSRRQRCPLATGLDKPAIQSTTTMKAPKEAQRSPLVSFISRRL